MAGKRPGRPRTTSCAKNHYGEACIACARERKRRSRKAARTARRLLIEAPLDELQKSIKRAREYVRAYQRRGAIAPPDACESCESDVRPTPHRDGRKLLIFHPDPATPRVVAWLCAGCFKRVSATRESLSLSWVWPGTQGPRSPRRPKIDVKIADLRESVETRLALASQSTRLSVLIGTTMSTIADADRQRLFMEGVKFGRAWTPTGDGEVDAALRAWVHVEHEARGQTSRSANGLTVTPIAARERKRRVLSSETSAPTTVTRTPFDHEAHKIRESAAVERLAEADRLADEANARALEALARIMGRKSSPKQSL